MSKFRLFGSVSVLGVVAIACSHQQTTASASATAQPSATAAVAVTPVASTVPQTDGVAVPTAPAAVESPSPFEGAEFFVNPEYTAKLEAAAKADKANAAVIRKVAAYPTAIWVDSLTSVARVGKALEAAEKQAKASTKPIVVVFALYDMPNRDCSAKASAGELDVAKGGEQKYKAEFIDKIAAQFAEHSKLRIVAIMEPDSLPNLATNMNVAKCASADKIYRSSIAYAVSKLNMPQVSVYLDAGHAGWLGWQGNPEKIAKIYKDVLTQAGGADKIRGFATNVSNYNTVSGGDGKKLGPANPCPDEASYIVKLTAALKAEGITGKKFIIDTSRDGKVVRASWSSWCNIKDAGLGPRPQASPMPLVDAYFWVKPPGESDGTSNPKAARFDAGCASADSMPNAPESGDWFGAHFVEIVKNAVPAL